MTDPTFTDRYGGVRDLSEVHPWIACQDCPAEIRNTEWRFRVIHEATCPTWLRYAQKLPGYTAMPSGAIVRAGEDPPEGTTVLVRNSGTGGPCGTSVTHRGPYKRRAA